MSMLDPAEVFRQEASELLDRLESTLLDLGQAPQDRELIDTAENGSGIVVGSGSVT